MWADIQFLGEITGARVPGLVQRCWDTAGQPPHLIVDLTRVSMLDGDALQALGDLGEQYSDAGGELRIVAGDSIAGIELREQGRTVVLDSMEDARAENL